MFSLKNHMEDIVEKLVEEYSRDNEHIHNCQKCKLDAMAVALNNLSPVYVVSDRGALFASIESTYLQNQVDAEIAVLNAMDVVKAAPRH